MKKLFIGNLPNNTTEESITALFSEYGTVRSLNLVTDIFTGKCKGFGFIEMEATRPVPPLPDWMVKPLVTSF